MSATTQTKGTLLRGPVVLRATYFSHGYHFHSPEGAGPKRGRSAKAIGRGRRDVQLPTANLVADAFWDLGRLFDYASSLYDLPLPTSHRPPFGNWLHVCSARLESPLEVVATAPVDLWLGVGFGVLLLAERIRTFEVRVSRKIKEELLRSELIDAKRRDILKAQADALQHHWRRTEREVLNLNKLDVLDAREEDEDLEDLDEIFDFNLD